MRHFILSLLVLPALLACPGTTASDAGASDAGKKDAGTFVDSGTPPTNEVTGPTSFPVGSAVVVWGSVLADGGVERDFVRVLVTTLPRTDACLAASTFFSSTHLTLQAYDLDFNATPNQDLKAGSYPFSLDTTLAWSQALYFNETDGGLISPTAEGVYGDGGITLLAINWPSVVSKGVVSGGNVDGTFAGGLEFSGTPDSGVSGSFHALGCENQPLMPARL